MRISSAIIAIVFIFMFGGCCEKNSVEPEPMPTRNCSTFNRTINIEVFDGNATHGSITWEDIAEIENLIKAKKIFNNKVTELNAKY